MNNNFNENEQHDEAVMAKDEIPVSEEESVVDMPQDETVMDIDDLKATVVKLRGEVDTNLDGWQRSRAEFNNYRRRTQQQLSDSKQQGAIDALTKILPVIDDFERAFTNIPDDLAEHPWVTGTSLILKNIQKVMDEFNIEVLDPVGEEFDPNMHEAIGMDNSSDYESGIVTTTLQKGYKAGDKVLRPALVRVAG
ncbi:MAG: nucleotide exchange factor GrpE [Phototrophicaceae bacterium]